MIATILTGWPKAARPNQCLRAHRTLQVLQDDIYVLLRPGHPGNTELGLIRPHSNITAILPITLVDLGKRIEVDRPLISLHSVRIQLRLAIPKNLNTQSSGNGLKRRWPRLFRTEATLMIEPTGEYPLHFRETRNTLQPLQDGVWIRSRHSLIRVQI